MAGPAGTGRSILTAVREDRGGSGRWRAEGEATKRLPKRSEFPLVALGDKRRAVSIADGSQLSLRASGNDFRILPFNSHGTPE